MATDGIRDIFKRIGSIVLNLPEDQVENMEPVIHSLVNKAWDDTRGRFGPPVEAQGYASSFLKIACEDFRDAYYIPTLAQADEIGGLIELWVNHSSSIPGLSQVGPDSHVSGIYDHFKGGVYRAFKVESNATNNGAPMVSYMSMLFATDHSRECWQWNEIVKWPDGKYRSRFVYRGKDLYTPPPSFKVPSPKLPYEA